MHINRQSSVTLIALSVALVGASHAGPVSAAGAASAPLRKSIATAQNVERFRLTATSPRTVRANFAVAYPAIGRGAGSARVRLVVWRSAARTSPLAQFEREVSPQRGGVGRVSITMGGAAGRLLARVMRRSPDQAARMVTVSSYHGRNLDSDGTVEHTHVVTAVGADVREAPRAQAAPSGSSHTATLTIKNDTRLPVWLTTSPVTCMHSNGTQGSAVGPLNGVWLAHGEQISHFVKSNASSTPMRGFSLDAVEPAHGHDLVVTPDYVADSIYSPEAAGALYMALAYYLQPDLSVDSHPQTFPSAREHLPNKKKQCSPARSRFVVGADQFHGHTAPTRPTGAHAAGMFTIADKNEIMLSASLDSGHPGLTMSARNDTITITDEQSTPQPYSGPDWMGSLYGDRSSRPLYSVAFPGAHDAGTGNLSNHTDWLMHGNSLCTAYQPSLTHQTARTYNWAQTQDLGIRQLLDTGIRYLDLRVGWDQGRGKNPGQKWRIVHTIFGQDDVEHVAETVASWAHAHPDEIVIVDFNHVCPESGSTDTLLHDLKRRDTVSGKSLCDVAYTTTGPPNALPSTTIADVRNSGRNVIVLLDPRAQYSRTSCGFYPLSDQTTNNGAGTADAAHVPINHLWPQNEGPGVCTPGGNDESAKQVQRYPLQPSPSIGTAPLLKSYRSAEPVPFTQTQILYTLTGKSVCTRSVYDTLLHYESTLNRVYRERILGKWCSLDPQRGGANIVIADQVDETFVHQLVKKCYRAAAPGGAS